jgi:outer membrane protein assembly factor BamB
MDLHTLLVAGIHGEVVAVERRTGRDRWRLSLDPDGGPVTVAVEAERLVFAATATHLHCIEYDSGLLLWWAPLAVRPPRGCRTALLVDAHTVMVGRRGVIDCFDRNGRLLWTRRIETTGDRDTMALPGHAVAFVAEAL